MTGRILQFKPRVETDITPLCIDILFQLAISVNVDPEVLVNSFREAHAGVKPPELTAAFALSHRVLCVFERLLLRAEYGDDVGDPEGAA